MLVSCDGNDGFWFVGQEGACESLAGEIQFELSAIAACASPVVSVTVAVAAGCEG